MMFGEWMIVLAVIAQAPRDAPRDRRIDDLIRQLTRPPATMPAVTTTTRPARPPWQQRLEALGAMDLSGLGKVEVMPVGPGNLAIIGEDEDVEALSRLIELMDQEIKPLELRVYKLENARPGDIARTVQSTFRELGSRRRSDRRGRAGAI